VEELLYLSATADEINRFQKIERDCRLGTAKMNIVNGDVKLTFGKVNHRPLVISESTKILASFKKNGIILYGESSSIRIIAKRDDVEVNLLSKDYSSPLSDLPEIKWLSDLKSVDALGGQHRQHALTRWVEEYEKNIRSLKSQRSKIAGKEGKEDIVEKVDEDLKTLKEGVSRLRWWTVIVYDIGS
jgi:hypothetical protein